VIRVTLTTICGTDLHILKGEYPVKPGLIIGHEPVGTIYELGIGVVGYKIGERVLVGAITPCGQCNYCLNGDWSQCGGPIGGWRFTPSSCVHGAPFAIARGDKSPALTDRSWRYSRRSGRQHGAGHPLSRRQLLVSFCNGQFLPQHLEHDTASFLVHQSENM
jgi:hypothetical protein